jgi:hypothetical protein
MIRPQRSICSAGLRPAYSLKLDQREVRLGQFCTAWKQAHADKKYRLERKRRRSFDAAIQ